jgi:hypothetical protein
MSRLLECVTQGGDDHGRELLCYHHLDVIPAIGCFGEGQAFLGFATATTDAGGHFAGTAHVAAVGAGQTVAATATDPAGNTSEFSGDFPPPPGPV